MRKISSVPVWAGHVLIAVLIAGCGGGGGGGDQPTAPVMPAITAQPQSQSVLTGATGTFTVSASPSADATYQWKRNGVAIAGATGPAYTTPPATYLDSGAQYSVVVANTAGSVTSASALLTLALSANQRAFESLSLSPNPGSYRLRWNLNYAGPQIVGMNYAYSDYAVLNASPLTNGPQVNAQSAPLNITSSLDLTNLVNSAPTRVLKNGKILVAPGTLESSRVSYVGSDVKVESLAADATTEAFTEIRSDYSSNPLTGVVASAPAEFAQWYNSFFSNKLILKPGNTFLEGSAYLKYTATNLGDRYEVFDCVGTTAGTNVAPCLSGTTLTAALTTGMVSDSDLKTYHLADGTVTTVSGVPVWVATAERPQWASLSSIVQYRIYFQLNGNVYTGTLIKDGTRVGGNYWVSNPSAAAVEDRLTYLPYQIRLNKLARDSIVNAMAI